MSDLEAVAAEYRRLCRVIRDIEAEIATQTKDLEMSKRALSVAHTKLMYARYDLYRVVDPEVYEGRGLTSIGRAER